MKNIPLISFARWKVATYEHRVLSLQLYQFAPNKWGCISRLIDVQHGEIECHVGNWRGTNKKFLKSAGGWLTTYLGIIDPDNLNTMPIFYVTDVTGETL